MKLITITPDLRLDTSIAIMVAAIAFVGAAAVAVGVGALSKQ